MSEHKMKQQCATCDRNVAKYEYKGVSMCGNCVTDREAQKKTYHFKDKTSFGDYSFQCSECSSQIIKAIDLRGAYYKGDTEFLVCQNCEMPEAGC